MGILKVYRIMRFLVRPVASLKLSSRRSEYTLLMANHILLGEAQSQQQSEMRSTVSKGLERAANKRQMPWYKLLQCQGPV